MADRYQYRQYRFGRPGGGYSTLTPVVKQLLIANGVIYLAQLLAPSFGVPLTSLCALRPADVVYRLRLWQPFTYMWLHAPDSAMHILFNMFTLWMFGSQVAMAWGARRFLSFYLVCGIGAGVLIAAWPGLLELLGVQTLSYSLPTLGASGAIYGVLLAFGVCYPDQTVLMGFLFPIKAKYMVMIYGAIALYGSMGINSGVSNIAHLGGMAVGFIYLRSRFPRMRVRLPDFQGAYRQWKLERAKRKFQVYMKKHGGGRGPWVN